MHTPTVFPDLQHLFDGFLGLGVLLVWRLDKDWTSVFKAKQWEPHLVLQGFLDIVPHYESMHKLLYVSVLRPGITSLCACTDLCRHDRNVPTSKHKMFAELKAKFNALWSWQFMSERTTSSRTVLIRAMREQSPPKMSLGEMTESQQAKRRNKTNDELTALAERWCIMQDFCQRTPCRFAWVFFLGYAAMPLQVVGGFHLFSSPSSSWNPWHPPRSWGQEGRPLDLATHEESVQIKNAFLESFVWKTFTGYGMESKLPANYWHWYFSGPDIFKPSPFHMSNAYHRINNLICWLSGFK